MDLWAEYRQEVIRVARRILREDQLSEDEVARGERRIGRKLPRALREYYLAFGAPSEINTAANRLLPPEELELRDGALIFYVEEQGVCVWGLRGDALDRDNPEVWIAENRAPLSLAPFAPDVVSFMRVMFYRQIVRGGRFSGWADDVSPQPLRALLATVAFPGVDMNGVSFFVGHDLIASLEGAFLHACARRREDLSWLEESLGIELEAGDLLAPTRGGVEAHARAVIKARRAQADAARAREASVVVNNDLCREMAARMREHGLACPHCGAESRTHRFIDGGKQRKSYFICASCSSSFQAQSITRGS